MSRLSSWWPGLALVAAFAAGVVWLGIGGGVVGSMLALLVVGPAYLIQNTIRRRRGHDVSGRGLHRDAGEIMDRFAHGYLQVVRGHRSVRLAQVMLSVGILTGLWVVAGPGWAVATMVAYVLTWVIAYAAARRARRRSA